MSYQFPHQDFKNWYYHQSKDYQGKKLSVYEKSWIDNKYQKETKTIKDFLTAECIHYYQPGDKFPFIIACEKGYINVVEIMIKYQLPTSRVGLSNASKYNHTKVVELLLNNGFTDRSKLGIFWASVNGNKEIFDLFLDKDINLHCQSKYWIYRNQHHHLKEYC